MSKSKQLAKNTIIIGIGKMSVFLANFLLLPLYTRYLNTSEYGALDFIIIMSNLIAPIVMLRMDMATFRWVVESKSSKRKMTQTLSSVTSIIALSWLLLSVVFGVIFLFSKDPVHLLIFLNISSLILYSFTSQIARGLGKMGIFAVASAISSLIGMGASILFVAGFGLGISGALSGLIIGYLVASLFLYLKLKIWRYIKLKKFKNNKLKRELIMFSAPMIPNGVSGWLTGAGNRMIIVGILGIAANGIYASATKVSNLISGMYEIFHTAWTEAVSANINCKDSDEFITKVFDISMRIFGSGLILVTASIPWVYDILIGPEYTEAFLYIPALSLGLFFDIVIRMIGSVYIAKKKTKQVMTTTIYSAVISLGLTLALIKPLGLWSAAISSVAAHAFLAAIRYKDINKYVSLKINARILTCIIVAFLAISAGYYLSDILIIKIVTPLIALIFAFIMNIGTIKGLKTEILSSKYFCKK